MYGDNANKKKALVDWTSECQDTFEHLKRLCTKPFQLHTDASESGLGVVLYQKQTNGTEGVMAYASWTLSRSK